tara:strand:+ start:391 stop:1017 length:627 start_codon:yes stop_codon:yes gene_type:complete
MNTEKYQNIKMVFNTAYIGLNKVADKEVILNLVSVDNDGLFDLYTFEVSGFKKDVVKVEVAYFGDLENHYRAIDLVTLELRAGNFEVINTVNELATTEQKQELENIIAFTNTKPQKFNVCRKCKGTGVYSQGHIRGNCFSCGKDKKGHNANKWLAIKLEAEKRLHAITSPITETQHDHFLNTLYPHLHGTFEKHTDQVIVRLKGKCGM